MTNKPTTALERIEESIEEHLRIYQGDKNNPNCIDIKTLCRRYRRQEKKLKAIDWIVQVGIGRSGPSEALARIATCVAEALAPEEKP